MSIESDMTYTERGKTLSKSGTVFHVGIDLGTSRTSIATSTGERLTQISCVGYAKDLIARKRLGAEYLLGQNALDNRLALNLVWPLAEGNIKGDEDIASVSLLIQHVIETALPERTAEDKVYAAIGVPAEASVKNKRDILTATQDLVDKILIVSEPFAVAFALDKLDENLIVDIGAGTTDLCALKGTFPAPEDQVTLPFAGNFLSAKLEEGILRQYPDVQLTQKIINSIKERHGYASETSDRILVELRVKGIPSEYDLTDIVKEACLELTNPICNAIQNLIGNFDPDFQDQMRNKIILAGGGSRLRGIDRAIEKSLERYGGGRATCVPDSEFCGATGCLKLAHEIPTEMWSEL